MRKVRSLARHAGGTRGGGGEAGMKRRTTEEIERADLEVEESREVGRRKDAHELFRTGGEDAGAGTVEVDAPEGGIGVDVSTEREVENAEESGTPTEGVDPNW